MVALEWHKVTCWYDKTRRYDCMCGEQFDDPLDIVIHLVKKTGLAVDPRIVIKMFTGKDLSTAAIRRLSEAL